MARPKNYSVSDVVERVVFAFWQHGYQSLGVRELEELTGLNQYAIRTEFGGKEGLYLTALEMYCERAISSAMAPMKDGKIPEIIAFLQALVTKGSMTSSQFGCLVVNTGIENARVNSPRLEVAVARYWDTLEAHFVASLRNAQIDGQIDPAVDIEAMANGLVSGVMGVHTKNRV
ncbi:MAG: TetR/AcrR family transcriptional regulator, partial [Roseibium sp.]|uniref:TetR/AcrR family transcriptional regulator n=1 Tax=Roseibium sp. TaxID=1936156 RepID=UPI002604AA7C